MQVGPLPRHERSRSILADESGAIAVIAALAMVGVVAITGLAVEYGAAVSQKTKLQKALDAAVLAGVSSSGSAEALSSVVGGLSKDAKIAIAKNVFAANKANLPPIDGAQFRFEDEVLVGNASAHIDTALLQVIGIPRIDIGAQANATSSYVREPLCFMAMHPTRKHTLELDGAVSVIASDCHIYGNSNNVDDVVDPHTAQNFLVGKSVQAVGFGHHELQNVTPPLEHAPELIPDPLASLPIPPAGRCDFTNIVVAGGSRTLMPGFYCGGLKITGGATVTFAPGLYSISGGKFIVTDSDISGSGVTVSLADSAVQLMWTRSKIRLSAPKLDQLSRHRHDGRSRRSRPCARCLNCRPSRCCLSSEWRIQLVEYWYAVDHCKMDGMDRRWRLLDRRRHD